MDGRRIDDLAVLLAAPSRRGALRLLAGAGLAVLGREAAAARCVKAGKRCEPGDRCCPGTRCKRRRCKCTDPNLVACKGRCVDPATFQHDEANCGGCGNACAPGQTCYLIPYSGGVSACCTAPEGTCESVNECCVYTAADCGYIDNDKGHPLFGCGHLEGQNRCCFKPNYLSGCTSDCQCCGSAVCRDGVCRLPG